MLYFIQLFINAIVNSSGDEEYTDQVHEAPTSRFKIVGDNIDIGIKARYMRSTQFINHSLHYFNSFAVLNRINFQEYSNSPLHICFNEPKKRALLVLPSKQDDETIESNMAVLISRVLVKHMSFFKHTFDDVINWHIDHKYQKEMSTKSVVVSDVTVN